MAFAEHQPTVRVIAILESLADKTEGMSLTEIAKISGFPKGTISPIIHTLVKHKFVFLNQETKKYNIGIAAYCIGTSYAGNMNTLKFIKEEMQYIVNKTGEICQTGVLVGGDILYVAKVDSEMPIRIISHVGAKLPAYCTALGKAILSYKNIDDIRALYPDGLKQITANTITDFSVLENELKKTYDAKLAVEHGEVNEQTCCIAVPLSKNDDQAIAAISVSIPFFRETPKKIELIENLLMEARAKIEIYFREYNVDVDNLITMKLLREPV